MDNYLENGSLDPEKINVHEYYEVEHWAKELDTNVEVLKNAVEHVGAKIADIKRYLKVA
jgi:antitoxin component HigA of HigAB toxin-antitoxin module